MAFYFIILFLLSDLQNYGIIPRGRKVYKMIWDAAILRKSTASEIFLTLLFVVKSYCRQPTYVLTGRKKTP